jgi:hypothetical protein
MQPSEIQLGYEPNRAALNGYFEMINLQEWASSPRKTKKGHVKKHLDRHVRQFNMQPFAFLSGVQFCQTH